MVIHAHDDRGSPVRLTFHPLLQWGLGICASLITAAVLWGISTIVDLDKRVTAIESSRFTQEDADGFVSVREYDAHLASVLNQLQRIEDKLDRTVGP